MGKIVGLIVKPPQVFVCPECGKEYKTEDGLTKHMEKEHPVDGE
jgi:uncharacterized C2H2 Zn-finger protein